MRKTKWDSLNYLTLLIILLIMVSSILTVRAFHTAEDSLLQENNKHLFDIAHFVDHGIENISSKLYSKIEFAVYSDAVRESERVYLETGDAQQILDAITSTDPLASISVDVILIRDGTTLIFSSSEYAPSRYNFPTGCDDMTVCVGPDGTSYIAFVRRSRQTDLQYIALVNLKNLYGELALNSLYDDYNVIMYDRSHDVILENLHNVPDFKLLNSTRSERSASYDIVSDFENAGKTGVSSFDYISEGGETVGSRIVVIPSTVSYNGIFAVSVSTDSRTIFTPVRQMEYRILGTSITLSLSITSLVIMIYFSIKRQNSVNKRIQQLNAEKEITEKLLAQQKELAHHQKLETIGTLTSGVAHEFNNLLAPIMSNSILIIEKLPPEDTATYDSALAIYNASYRAKQLVSSFSRLSRKSNAEKFVDVPLSDIIESTLNIVSASQPKNVSVKAQLDPDCILRCDEPQISHILMNLFLNSFQAMEDGGGVLTVKDGKDRNNVWFSVSDTGRGIPDEYLDKIYDPFFTTKEVGKGTGLGLAIVQQTVQQYNGRIDVKSSAEGTEFTVYFPKP